MLLMRPLEVRNGNPLLLQIQIGGNGPDDVTKKLLGVGIASAAPIVLLPVLGLAAQTTTSAPSSRPA